MERVGISLMNKQGMLIQLFQHLYLAKFNWHSEKDNRFNNILEI